VFRPPTRNVVFIGSSQEDLRAFPGPVREVVGFALYVAQCGGKHPAAKPLKGFLGSGVLECCEDFDGDTYRAVYTVRFDEAVYVLNAFQKKSRRGTETPKREIDLVRRRLRVAEALHGARTARGGGSPNEE
jgi:phage-related protein